MKGPGTSGGPPPASGGRQEAGLSFFTAGVGMAPEGEGLQQGSGCQTVSIRPGGVDGAGALPRRDTWFEQVGLGQQAGVTAMWRQFGEDDKGGRTHTNRWVLITAWPHGPQPDGLCQWSVAAACTGAQIKSLVQLPSAQPLQTKTACTGDPSARLTHGSVKPRLTDWYMSMP